MSLRCIQIIQKLCQNSDPDLTGLGGELEGVQKTSVSNKLQVMLMMLVHGHILSDASLLICFNQL